MGPNGRNARDYTTPSYSSSGKGLRTWRQQNMRILRTNVYKIVLDWGTMCIDNNDISRLNSVCVVSDSVALMDVFQI